MNATAATSTVDLSLQHTPLHDLHLELGAKMVPFAGFEMPLRYPPGIIAEHLQTRSAASLFDVSHMGQVEITGPSHAVTSAALERLMPQDIRGLAYGQVRYCQFLNDDGGIVDDLMVTRPIGPDRDGCLSLVINASRISEDRDFLERQLPDDVTLSETSTDGLIALQGPAAAEVIERHCPEAAELTFMTATVAVFDGIECHIGRTGYTGEDGFEISADHAHIETVARALLSDSKVEPAGLGARDSLRLEAALSLFGNELDEATSPIEAGLGWSIGATRKQDGGFPGDARILDEIKNGPKRRLIGIRPVDRAPAREGTEIRSDDDRAIGHVTSGVFSPSLEHPIALGYVEREYAKTGAEIGLVIRGRKKTAHIVKTPFVPHRYYRTSSR